MDAEQRQALREAVIRKTLSQPNAELARIRSEDRKLERGLRRASIARTGGKVGALLGGLGAVGLAVATVLGAPLMIPALAAAGAAAVAGAVAVGANARRPSLRVARSELGHSLEGKLLEAERQLARVEAARGSLGTRYQEMERELERVMGPQDVERRAAVLRRARARQVERVQQLDAIRARCRDLIARLNRASLLAQAEEELERVSQADEDFHYESDKLAFEQEQICDEVDNLLIDFQAQQEVELLYGD